MHKTKKKKHSLTIDTFESIKKGRGKEDNEKKEVKILVKKSTMRNFISLLTKKICVVRDLSNFANDV